MMIPRLTDGILLCHTRGFLVICSSPCNSSSSMAAGVESTRGLMMVHLWMIQQEASQGILPSYLIKLRVC